MTKQSRWLVLGVVVGLAAACNQRVDVGPGSECRSSCDGCCSEDGACRRPSNETCGSPNGACFSCPGGFSCDGRACVPNSGEGGGGEGGFGGGGEGAGSEGGGFGGEGGGFGGTGGDGFGGGFTGTGGGGVGGGGATGGSGGGVTMVTVGTWCQEDGWCLESPFPSQPINALWASGPNDIWAAGDAATVFHYDGLRWEQLTVPGGRRVLAIGGTGPNDVWAGTQGGHTLRWNGAGWTNVPNQFAGSRITGISVLSPTSAWAAGANGVERWNGVSWSNQSPSFSVEHIWAASDTEVYVAGYGSVGRWNGSTWTKITAPNVSYTAVTGTGPGDAWVVGGSSTVLHYSGGNWQLVPVPPQYASGFNGVHRAGASVVFRYNGLFAQWSAASGFTTTMSHNLTPQAVWAWSPTSALAGGSGMWNLAPASMQRIAANVPEQFEDIHLAGANDLWAIGRGSLWRFDGTTWRSLLNGSWGSFERVWADSAGNEAWISTSSSSGVLARWQPSGITAVNLTPASRIWAVHGSGSSNVFAVGEGGRCWRWSGSFWTQVPTGVSSELRAVFAATPSAAWAVGANGALTEWNGLAWTPASSGVSTRLLAVHATGNDVWAVGEMGVTLQKTAMGWTKRVITGAPELQSVYVAGPREVYAGNGSGLWRFNGYEWLQLTGVARGERLTGIARAVWSSGWSATGPVLARLGGGISCDAAWPLSPGKVTSMNAAMFGDRHGGAFNGCPSGADNDVAFSVEVPAGQSISLTVTPQNFDATLALMADPAACGSRTCVLGVNAFTGPQAETLTWNNTGASPRTVNLIVDSIADGGFFQVFPKLGPPVACSAATCPTGCCQNGTCVTGTAEAACGTGGAACNTCGQYQLCTGQACVDQTRSTGAPCTATSQCTAGIFLETPTCRTTWPGGYCSASCFLSETCGDLFNPGYCTSSGVCLSRCPAPGTGQSTCRNDYVCVATGSTTAPGVCLPKCQAVPCAAGRTCMPSGYCS